MRTNIKAVMAVMLALAGGAYAADFSDMQSLKASEVKTLTGISVPAAQPVVDKVTTYNEVTTFTSAIYDDGETYEEDEANAAEAMKNYVDKLKAANITVLNASLRRTGDHNRGFTIIYLIKDAKISTFTSATYDDGENYDEDQANAEKAMQNTVAMLEAAKVVILDYHLVKTGDHMRAFIVYYLAKAN